MIEIKTVLGEPSGSVQIASESERRKTRGLWRKCVRGVSREAVVQAIWGGEETKRRGEGGEG